MKVSRGTNSDHEHRAAEVEPHFLLDFLSREFPKKSGKVIENRTKLDEFIGFTSSSINVTSYV